ncbi:MAG: hypothetical protein J6Y70_00995 [Bacilli bacterium]|nr:hypothetical protein [Bacilli bacterium]
MSEKIIFSIITPDKKNSFKISKLYIKTIMGYSTILHGHADLITVVTPSKGFFEIKNKINFKINTESILNIKNGKIELITDNIIIYT